jgi:hypothetical protein
VIEPQPCTEIDGAATRRLADYKKLALGLLDSCLL